MRRLKSKNIEIFSTFERNIYANILVKLEIRIVEQKLTRIILDDRVLRAQFEQLLRTLEYSKIIVINKIDYIFFFSNFIFINENILTKILHRYLKNKYSNTYVKKITSDI